MFAGDLSRYRDFQLGMDLPTVAKHARMSPSQANVVHLRPALIQELEWRPRPLGPSSQAEPAKEVIFSFYNGELFRIAISYDRYDTEGLTPADLVEAISATYGTATRPVAASSASPAPYGDSDEVVARWQDSQYSFDLIRSSYGPSFRLVAASRRLDALAQTAIAEADRLDQQEAPQRNVARLKKEADEERAKQDKARLANKPNFRP